MIHQIQGHYTVRVHAAAMNVAPSVHSSHMLFLSWFSFYIPIIQREKKRRKCSSQFKLHSLHGVACLLFYGKPTPSVIIFWHLLMEEEVKYAKQQQQQQQQ